MKTTHSRWLFPVLLMLILLAAACSAPGVNRLENFSLSKEPLTGKFVWHDLITDDVERVKRFYGGLFGWTFEDTTRPNGGDYTLIMNGDRFVGGIVQLDDPSGVEYSRWLGYLSVDDVDIAAGFTEAQGGRAVVGPIDLPGIGRAAAIQDPQQAVLGLLRSEPGDPDDSMEPGPGLVVWNELLAADADAATSFYTSLAGFKVDRQEREGGFYHVLESQGQRRAGVMERPSEQLDPLWLTHFGVVDVRAATQKVSELGGRVLLGPDRELRFGLMAVVVDPNGAILALHQWTK